MNIRVSLKREDEMRSAFAAIFVVLLSVSAVQAQTGNASSGGFEKKHFNYSEWTKGLFQRS
jgi:hypothetical protein